MQLAPCLEHPEERVTKVCYHSTCRGKGQLLCQKCVAEKRHQGHDKHLEALNPSSPTFQLITGVQQKDWRYDLLRKLNEVEEFVTDVEEVMLEDLKQWKLRKLTKLQCLINFLDKSSLPRVFSNLQAHDRSHDSCCLQMINFLHDISGKSVVDIESIKKGLEEQIVAEVKNIMMKSSNAKEIMSEMLKSSSYEKVYLVSNKVKEEIINITASFEQIIKGNINNKLIDIASDKTAIYCQSKSPQEQENRVLAEEVISLQENEKSFIDQIEKKNRKKISDIMELLSNQQIKEEEQQDEEESISNPILSISQPKIKKIKKKTILNRSRSLSLQIEQLFKKNKTRNIIELSQEQLNSQNKKIYHQKLTQPELEKPKNIMPGPSPPLGVHKENQQLVSIYTKANLPDLISYLSSVRMVQYLIIKSEPLSTDVNMSKLLQACSYIKGVHIQCQHTLTIDFVRKSKVKYFTFMHSYRFIRETDNFTYFPSEIPKPIQNMMIYNKKKGSFSAHNKNQFDIILQTPQQINIFTQPHKNQWTITQGNITGLKYKCNNIIILSFTDIKFAKRIKLQEIYQRNMFLQTLVFNNCQCSLGQIVREFGSISVLNFKNLQISAAKLEHKPTLSGPKFKKICQLLNLSTLILVNINFQEAKIIYQDIDQVSKYFNCLKKLKKLSHLNLSKSTNIDSYCLSQIDPQCLKQLITLNLGHTAIQSQSTKILSQMTKLKNLNLDFTRLGGQQFLQLLPCLTSLEKLSIQHLNGEIITFDNKKKPYEMDRFGFVSETHLINISNNTIIYLNICGCLQLKSFFWSQFSCLRYLVTDQNQLDAFTKQKLVQKGVFIVEKGESRKKVESIKKLSSRRQSRPSKGVSQIISVKKTQSNLNNKSVRVFQSTQKSFKRSRRQQFVTLHTLPKPSSLLSGLFTSKKDRTLEPQEVLSSLRSDREANYQ